MAVATFQVLMETLQVKPHQYILLLMHTATHADWLVMSGHTNPMQSLVNNSRHSLF